MCAYAVWECEDLQPPVSCTDRFVVTSLILPKFYNSRMGEESENACHQDTKRNLLLPAYEWDHLMTLRSRRFRCPSKRQLLLAPHTYPNPGGSGSAFFLPSRPWRKQSVLCFIRIEQLSTLWNELYRNFLSSLCVLFLEWGKQKKRIKHSKGFWFLLSSMGFTVWFKPKRLIWVC